MADSGRPSSARLLALAGARIALTADDAPSIGMPGGSGFAADRMDRVREILQEQAVPHCTAFVVGAAAAGETARLRRWLAAGYALGNHTQSHRHASAVAVSEFVADVAACDDLLQTVGAFATGAKHFRFPYLDTGALAHGDEVRRAIEGLGHRVAHGSVDLWDYRFEQPMAAALVAGDERRVQAIERRYVEVVLRTFVHERGAVRRAFGADAPCIPFFHFGGVAVRCLPAILEQLGRAGVVWIELRDALDHRAFAAPPVTGRVSPTLRSVGAGRLVRRLANWSFDAGLFRQRQLGPLWPHLS